SAYWSCLVVTRITSSPFIQRTTFPEHLSHSQLAFIGFVNQTRLANLEVLSVNAPTGQTSITFPIKSLSRALFKYVEISACSPLKRIPCSRSSVSWFAASTQRAHRMHRFMLSLIYGPISSESKVLRSNSVRVLSRPCSYPRS